MIDSQAGLVPIAPLPGVMTQKEVAEFLRCEESTVKRYVAQHELKTIQVGKGYVRAAGIEMTAPFDLKTFRKSFAQNAADNAIPPRTLAEFLGDDVRVVMRYYQQVTPQAKRAVVDAIDRQFKKHAKLKNPPGAS